MTLQAAVSEAEDGRYVVRLVNGVGAPIEYRCASAAHVRQLMDVLGLAASPATSVRPVPETQPPGYRVELTPPSRSEIRLLAEHEWEEVRRELARISVAAAEASPPSRAMLAAAGVQPPVLRHRVGRHVIVYDTDANERTLSVLHVLDVD
jgi:hypothetical protein